MTVLARIAALLVVAHDPAARGVAVRTPAYRSLEPEDSTEAWIDAGTVVEVQVVTISRPAGHVRSAWARVSPSPKK